MQGTIHSGCAFCFILSHMRASSHWQALSPFPQRLRERMAAMTAEKAEALILEGLVGQHAEKATIDTFRDLYRRYVLRV